MNSTYFQHRHIRSYTVAFGKLFSNIYVHRTDPYEVDIQNFKVPVTPASKTKMWMSLKQEVPGYSRSISVELPRMAYVLSGIEINHEEKLHELHKITSFLSDDNKKAIHTYSPTPITMSYTLSIWAKYQEDALQIIEQIIPYFHKSHSINMKIFTPMEMTYVVPITLNNITSDIQADMDSEPSSIRIVQWSMDFSMKGFLFKPVIDASIIKKAYVNVLGYDDNDDPDPYSPYFQITDEVYPLTSEFSDDWQIKETLTEDDETIEKFVERLR